MANRPKGLCDEKSLHASDHPRFRGWSLCVQQQNKFRLGRKRIGVIACTLCGLIAYLKLHDTGVPAARTALSKPSQLQVDVAASILPAGFGYDQKLQSNLIHSGGWNDELTSLELLAKTVPDAAIRRVDQIRDNHERKSAAMAVCRVVAINDPATALKAAWGFNLGRFADDHVEYQTLEDLARRWADVDLALTLEWVAALPMDEEARRDRLVKGIISSIARSDPSLAARMVTETISADTPVQAEATMDVLRYWPARDYKAAITWLSNLPSTLARERGIDQLALTDLQGE